MKVDKQRLAEFKKRRDENSDWYGPGFEGFLNAAGARRVDPALYLGDFDRARLKAIAQEDSGFSDSDVMWAILWWGGMDRRNALRLADQERDREAKGLEPKVSDIVKRLRRGSLRRDAAYDELRELNKSNGLGPAFFTKLIYFAGKAHDGYIMDQWVARSVNFLFNEQIVKMNGNTVASSNTSKTYEKFCKKIKWLADDSEISPEQAEMRLFSPTWDKGADTWRNYHREQTDNRKKTSG